MSIDKLDLQSPDLVNENFEKLAALFPNCVTESAERKAIDFDLLKQELSHAVIDGNRERYRLEWPGKRESIVTANLPTTKTLRPVREDSADFDNTENLYIEGDNLEVLKILQESYLGNDLETECLLQTSLNGFSTIRQLKTLNANHFSLSINYPLFLPFSF